jgi:hypothetical protein
MSEFMFELNVLHCKADKAFAIIHELFGVILCINIFSSESALVRGINAAGVSVLPAHICGIKDVFSCEQAGCLMLV